MPSFVCLAACRCRVCVRRCRYRVSVSATRMSQNKASPAEMAYAVLWRIDKEPTDATRKARKLLLDEIGKDGQKRGIMWAREIFGEVTEAEIWADAWRMP